MTVKTREITAIMPALHRRADGGWLMSVRVTSIDPTTGKVEEAYFGTNIGQPAETWRDAFSAVAHWLTQIEAGEGNPRKVVLHK